LSEPDTRAAPALDALAFARLPRDAEGPVFADPWQGQAFALAVRLSEQGHFTWTEWARALSVELKSAAARGEPDDGSRYYEHWLAALEKLVAAKGLSDVHSLARRKAQWRAAYLATPHGKPVTLASHGQSVVPEDDGESNAAAAVRQQRSR
jgi:nitrile hydratase accessory protein